MKISNDLVHGLKRHLIGGSREPSPVWFAAADRPYLGFQGEGIEEGPEGCTVFLGTFPGVEAHRHRLHVENLTQEALFLTLTNFIPWLQAWFPERTLDSVLNRSGGAVDLELIFQGKPVAESSFTGAFQILAEMESGAKKSFTVEVRAGVHLDFPMGDFDFGGSPEPTVHDFGTIDPVTTTAGASEYVLSVVALGRQPLLVSFEDLPDWLTFEERGYPRRGPASGRFFERQAPLTVCLRPTPLLLKLGPQRGRLVLRSNDERPAYGQISLEFCANLEIEKSHVMVEPPPTVEVVDQGVSVVEIALANWGRSPARLTLESGNPALFVETFPEVPSASGLLPGRALLQATVSAHSLPPGKHLLTLSLRVEDGLPGVATTTFEVTVVRVLSRPEVLDFGTLGFGSARRRHIRFKASDHRQLHLTARPLPEMAEHLRITRVSGHSVFVVCQPSRPASKRSIAYLGPGLEIVDASLRFRREMVVRFRAGSPWRRRFLMFSGIVIAILTLVALLLAVSKAS